MTTTPGHHHAFLLAAATAVDLLADPAVAENWGEPSALPEFGVSGLAGHLASQLFQVEQRLDDPPTAEAPIALLDHYVGVSWREGDHTTEVNVRIRDNGEEYAAGGSAALVARARLCLERLHDLLPAADPDRPLFLPQGPWALTVHDFLITRMMEISVHNDDLAVSVGLPTPDQDDAVNRPVLDLLSAVAERRHGPLALTRAYSRSERSPGSISAF